ncbi:hypothetical protein U0070_017685 [Myodes glareolus]|uniref:Uncharacterized protein n=1 Tax=Myodes glareolus TaxID=447135 RepID=A0AAW0K5A6_MYOGA
MTGSLVSDTYTIQSTARIRERYSVDSPMASRIMAMVRTPPAGTPAAPTLDAVAVTLEDGKAKSTLLSWAMNTAATHWKMAAPSMFTVAPMGRMNLLILLSTPLFSSMHFIIDGRVAELEKNKTIQHQSSPSQPGGERGSKRCEEAQEESVRVFPCKSKIDKRQNNSSMNNMAQDRCEDVFPEAGHKHDDILHFHNLASNQERDAYRYVPRSQAQTLIKEMLRRGWEMLGLWGGAEEGLGDAGPLGSQFKANLGYMRLYFKKPNQTKTKPQFSPQNDGDQVKRHACSESYTMSFLR